MLDQSAAPSAANKTIFLKDYRTPNFLVDTVALDFELGETVTSVISKLTLRRNADGETHAPLVLDGEQLELTCLELDGKQLDETEYQLVGDQLIVAEVPDKFELVSTVLIKPQENTQLSGLYKSSGNFCTQCEAEGFRRITFFPDRPDVLSIFSVRIVADHKLYPVLLSNGNPTEKGEMDDGRHWAQWEDPWPKPSYLFALVAGDLGQIEDSFVTMGGKEIILRIYTEHHNVEKCDHAMRSLRKSMQWDEEVYGREYDLDVYNIVAVDD
ncbi:MAG TPA: aminopeptidase N, partial [Gammaproteobacteria bacterium]|nr:aminopeptidase N [Gammaproteobacteria bacterium]